MSEAPSIQWFPGHMAKTRRMIGDSLRLVDLVVELLDARIPRASTNPEWGRILGKKPRLVLLGKADAADAAVTALWCKAFAAKGVEALWADCRSGRGLDKFTPAVERALHDVIARRREKGMTGAGIRLMVVGIPNVGKSSLINRLAGGKRAKVEDRPGVTRGRQWVTLENGMELLDMPGVLWPKFQDSTVAEHLAFVGSVKDDVLDTEALAGRLLEELARNYPGRLCERYKLENADGEGYELLERIGRGRGMLLPGGVVNTERAAAAVLDEFRAGTMGRISLERP